MNFTSITTMEEVSTITYESLYNLVRNEKTNGEIQNLNPEVYAQLVNYLKTKIQIYKDAKIKKLKEVDKIKIQIVSARKLIKDFYELREKKILHLAINKSRTKQADDTNLLEQEKVILSKITDILDIYRKDILLELVNARLPYSEDVIEKQQPKPIENIEQPAVKEKIKIKKIKFNSELGKFLGKNLEVLGPFKEGDIVELDWEIADVIINKKLAVQI